MVVAFTIDTSNQEKAMSSMGAHGKAPWQPHLETQAEFNPFVSPIAHLGEPESQIMEGEADEEPATALEQPKLVLDSEPHS
jgi:hypothetical protein